MARTPFFQVEWYSWLVVSSASHRFLKSSRSFSTSVISSESMVVLRHLAQQVCFLQQLRIIELRIAAKGPMMITPTPSAIKKVIMASYISLEVPSSLQSIIIKVEAVRYTTERMTWKKLEQPFEYLKE